MTQKSKDDKTPTNSVVLLFKKCALIFVLILLIIASAVCVWKIVEAAIAFGAAAKDATKVVDVSSLLFPFIALDVIVGVLIFWIYFTKRFFKRLKKSQKINK